MSTIISPRKTGSGLLQNFTSSDAPDIRSTTSRVAIKDELSGKLRFQVAHVFDHLGIDDVPSSLINACVASLDGDIDVQNAKQRLMELADPAKKAEEEQMYRPLSTIFHRIEQFVEPNIQRKFDRQILPLNSSTLITEGDTWSFPLISPDFTMLDITDASPRVSSADERTTRLWRCRSGFVEVKPKERDGPVPSDPKTVKEIVVQAADYARLHMSARPFQLFSVGLLIFGTKFCVAIFDRDGVQFSPIKDMWDDNCIFVRVIRRLTCDISSVQLGQDPTAYILSNAEAVPWQNRAKEMGMRSFPTYRVTMGTGSRCWYTLGPPIWSSLSLLGRGTSVWRVCDAANPGKLFVLKNAWRSSERLAESVIYQAIQGSHPGVAEYEFGGDVMFPGTDRLISVNNLRDTDAITDTPILHRLLIATIGRPLWEYTSDLELLLGIRAALKGHQFLYDQGILHRDVSAGNILLSLEKRPKPGHEGFVMDVEYAHIADSSVNIETKTDVPPVRGPGGIMTAPTTRSHKRFQSVKRGAAMTGTAQFMALEILEAMQNNEPIAHNCNHDIESFIWVLCYSVGRRWISTGRMEKERRRDLSTFFHNNFGRAMLHTILTTRIGRSGPLDIAEKYAEVATQPLKSLLGDLRALVWTAHTPPNPRNAGVVLSYEEVLGLMDRAIQELQSS